jgi:hypothetical protein
VLYNERRMKRFPIAVAAIIILATSLLAAQAQGRTLVSEELAHPVASPVVLTSGTATLVLFTSALADPLIRGPKLQFFDPAKKGRWRTLGSLRDDGKFGDAVSGDRTFTLRVQILDSGGTVHLSVMGRKLHHERDVPSPVRLRLIAKKKRQRGLVVSAPLTMGSWQNVQDATIGYSATQPTSWVLSAAPNSQTAVWMPPFTSDDTSFDGTGSIAVHSVANPNGLDVVAFYATKPEGWNPADSAEEVITWISPSGKTFTIFKQASDGMVPFDLYAIRCGTNVLEFTNTADSDLNFLAMLDSFQCTM